MAWNVLLPRLGVTVKGLPLPGLVQCPLCQKLKLRIYHDPVFEGQWSFCESCDFHGDMIELASACWKLNIEATCRRLEESGFDLSTDLPFDRAIRHYEQNFVNVRKDADKFWKECQDYFAAAESPQLRGLQKRVGTDTSTLGNMWKHYGGEILGANHYSALDFKFHPGLNGRETSTQGSRLFKGKGWGEVLVIPFWRLPGRLTGFLCLGRKLDPETDFVYVPVREGSVYTYRFEFSQNSQDAGIGMLPAVFARQHEALGNTLTVTNDPKTALRLQLRHMKSTQTLLPLVLTYTNHSAIITNTRTLKWIPKQKVVFWSPRIDMSMMKQAYRAKAKFSLYELPESEIDGRTTHMRHHAPHEWLHIINGRSKWWYSSLRLLMQTMDENEIDQTITNLEINGPDLRAFMAGCSPELREKLEGIEKARTIARQVQYDDKTITEEPDGWYVNGSCISSAIIRIEQMLQAKDTNYYRGFIRFNGVDVPFTEQTDTLRHRLLRWANSYLEINGHAGMTYVTSWDTKAINVALLFCKPQVVTGVDSIGWDASRSQFNFPRFSLRIGGEILEDYACLFNDPKLPARELHPPMSLSRKEIQTLGEHNEETALLWGTAAAIAANVIAPAIHSDKQGLILNGAGALTIGRAAMAGLGCPIYPDQEYQTNSRKMIARYQQQTERHGWPFFLDLGANPHLTCIEDWLVGSNVRQAIVPLPWGSARIMGIRGWNILRCERKLGSMQTPQRTVSRILPGYLHHLCSNHLFVNNVSESHVENVVRDMANWFTIQCGGNGLAVLDALHYFELPETFPAYLHFMDVVFRFIHDGKLTLERRNFENEHDGESVVYEVDNEPAVWIPEAKVVDLLEKLCFATPAVLAITRSLEAAGSLVGQRTYQDKRGWLVAEAWWTKQHIEWKKRTAQIGGPTL